MTDGDICDEMEAILHEMDAMVMLLESTTNDVVDALVELRARRTALANQVAALRHRVLVVTH
jgi:hypothetical protein